MALLRTFPCFFTTNNNNNNNMLRQKQPALITKEEEDSSEDRSSTSRDDTGEDAFTRRMTNRIRRATVWQLASHALCTPRLWAQSLLLPATTDAKLSVIPPPRIAVLEMQIPAWMERLAASVYLVGLVLQLCWPSSMMTTTTTTTTTTRKRLKKTTNVPEKNYHHPTFNLLTLSAWLCLLSWILLVLACDVWHLQPPVISGLACLLAVTSKKHDPGLVRIVLASTWMWSGLHKINPNFFVRHENNFVDPVLAGVVGQDLVETNRMALRCATAVSEAMAGGILLLTTVIAPRGNTTTTISNHNKSARAMLVQTSVQASLFFVLTMHAIIIQRLVQLNWNFHVLGWNICFFYLTVLLWFPHVGWWPRDTVPQSSIQLASAQITRTRYDKLLRLVYIVLLTILPAGVLCGFDPYLGHALYTDNLPTLQMELPIGSSVSKNYGLFDLYHSWGLVVADMPDSIPSTTADGRRVMWIRNLDWSLHTMGSVGFPALWAHRRWAKALCRSLCEFEERHESTWKNTGKASQQVRFYLTEHYTGVTLAESLGSAFWRLGKSPVSSSLPPLPAAWVSDKCTGSWRPFQWPAIADTHAGSFAERDSSVKVEFSAPVSNPPITLYWIKGQPSWTESPDLVFQAQLQSNPVRFQSFVGHRFVAARPKSSFQETHQENLVSSLCFVEMWIIGPAEAGQIPRYELGPDDVAISGSQKQLPGMPFWWAQCGFEENETLNNEHTDQDRATHFNSRQDEL